MVFIHISFKFLIILKELIVNFIIYLNKNYKIYFINELSFFRKYFLIKLLFLIKLSKKYNFVNIIKYYYFLFIDYFFL